MHHQTKKFLRVSPTRESTYEIRVEEPLLEPSNPSLVNIGESRERRLVILDDGLPSYFRNQIQEYFAINRTSIKILELPGGEGCKSFQIIQKLIEAFDEFSLNRRTEPVIIFGGGAVLDTAGFASSIYRRGVPYIRVPTTLLSYVDASVGVKTGINFSGRKNLVGSFSPPAMVFLERQFLPSLPDTEIASGLGEVIKLAVGCDETLLDSLEASVLNFKLKNFNEDSVLQILFRSVEIMVTELSQNIYENDLCRAVDLGHTFSQVFEMGPDRQVLRHGEAVAIDVILTAIISMHRGMLKYDEVCRIARISENLGLPMEIPNPDPQKLWNSVLERTCHRGGHQRLPLPKKIGNCIFINDLKPEEISQAMNEFERKFWREECLEKKQQVPVRFNVAKGMVAN